MRRNGRVVAITAAMCQGNMLEPVRDAVPGRFFDVGICESHAVAFAAGLAKAGMRPIVDIYSTFLQRSYDQVFQELALQNLPMVLLMDRAGVVGPDGPTHHGAFDLAYLRHLPNLVLMAPGDAADLPAMLDFALAADGPTAIRFAKAQAFTARRKPAPVELGVAEVLRWGRDGMIVACGTLLEACLDAAKQLAGEGLDVGVINARFVKPLDTSTILRAVAECPFVVTVEEACLQGGFGSAVLEAASDQGSTPAACAAWAFPTASSSTVAARNFWTNWGSTPRASPPPAWNWPAARNWPAPPGEKKPSRDWRRTLSQLPYWGCFTQRREGARGEWGCSLEKNEDGLVFFSPPLLSHVRHSLRFLPFSCFLLPFASQRLCVKLHLRETRFCVKLPSPTAAARKEPRPSIPGRGFIEFYNRCPCRNGIPPQRKALHRASILGPPWARRPCRGLASRAAAETGPHALLHVDLQDAEGRLVAGHGHLEGVEHPLGGVEVGDDPLADRRSAASESQSAGDSDQSR